VITQATQLESGAAGAAPASSGNAQASTGDQIVLGGVLFVMLAAPTRCECQLTGHRCENETRYGTIHQGLTLCYACGHHTIGQDQPPVCWCICRGCCPPREPTDAPIQPREGDNSAAGDPGIPEGTGATGAGAEEEPSGSFGATSAGAEEEHSSAAAEAEDEEPLRRRRKVFMGKTEMDQHLRKCLAPPDATGQWKVFDETWRPGDSKKLTQCECQATGHRCVNRMWYGTIHQGRRLCYACGHHPMGDDQPPICWCTCHGCCPQDARGA